MTHWPTIKPASHPSKELIHRPNEISLAQILRVWDSRTLDLFLERSEVSPESEIGSWVADLHVASQSVESVVLPQNVLLGELGRFFDHCSLPSASWKS